MTVIAELIGTILGVVAVWVILDILLYLEDILRYKTMLLKEKCKMNNIDTRNWLKKLIDKKKKNE